MLKLTDISHDYGSGLVLDRKSLTLLPGQRLALMGPSGCGKTTLLRIALGLLSPNRGRVENTFRKTAAVFQEPRLLPWHTALENVNLVLGDNQTTRDKAQAWLEAMRLGDAAQKYPRELSGGMQQRLSLARALAFQGDLLILDEPFKAMDTQLKDQIMACVAQTKAAILMVTHEEEEADALNCRILRI